WMPSATMPKPSSRRAWPRQHASIGWKRMVDLAKIRKKAKRAATSPAPDNRQPTTDDAAARLEAFLSTAGQKRAGVVEEPSPAAKDEIELLTFLLGDERYAIDIDAIAEIVSPRPATPVPNAGGDIAGIISLRGSIVTIIDIRARLKQPSRTASKETRLIVVRDRGGLLGFEV